MGGVCSSHGAKQIRTCSKKGCTKHAQLRGVCVAHGAKTKLCSHEGCTKQVVRGRKCKDHAGPAEIFDGACSIVGCHNSGAMTKVNKELVCNKRYPCMSHSCLKVSLQYLEILNPYSYFMFLGSFRVLS